MITALYELPPKPIFVQQCPEAKAAEERAKKKARQDLAKKKKVLCHLRWQRIARACLSQRFGLKIFFGIQCLTRTSVGGADHS